MTEAIYFTGSDAEFLLDSQDEPLDAAQFTLTAGRTPLHIWNYARRLDQEHDTRSGGAPFDDTALGNELCQVQLIVNRKRLIDFYDVFQPQTPIGNARIRYVTVGGEEVAFKLVNGHVGQIGEEYSTRNGLFQSVTLFFQRAETSTAQIPLPAERLPLLGERLHQVRAYEASIIFTTDGTRRARQYTPEFIQLDQNLVDPGTTLDVSEDLRRALSEYMPLGDIPSLAFRGAILESFEDDGTTLWIWDPTHTEGARYRPVLRRNSPEDPIIEDDKVDAFAGMLLGRLATGTVRLYSSDSFGLVDQNGAILLVDVAEIE